MPRIEESGGTYFVNFSLLDEKSALTTTERQLAYKVILDGNAIRYYLHAFVIMPTHVHLLVQALVDGKPVPLPKIMHNVKGYSALVINKSRGCKGALWLPRSNNRLITSTFEYDQKRDYIFDNPRRARLVKDPLEYPYLWFIGKDRDRNPEPG